MERMKIADKDKEGKDEDYDELAMEQHKLWQEKASLRKGRMSSLQICGENIYE